MKQDIWEFLRRPIGITQHGQNQPAENGILAMPLTPQELCLVDAALGIARESERTDGADTQMIGFIRKRILRFAERQGAWWDLPDDRGLWLPESIHGAHGKGGGTSKQAGKWWEFWKK
jgi:hypothetical protein